MKLKTREFFESRPSGVRSVAQLYHLSSKRHENGLEALGVCVRVPHIGVIWDTEKWEQWLSSHAA